MDIQSLMRQAQEMQKKIKQAQEEAAKKEYEGFSGGGLVKVIIGGDLVVKSVNIDESLLVKGEKDILEDLVVAAFNDAKKKADDGSTGSMKDIAGDMKLPDGFKF